MKKLYLPKKEEREVCAPATAGKRPRADADLSRSSGSHGSFDQASAKGSSPLEGAASGKSAPLLAEPVPAKHLTSKGELSESSLDSTGTSDSENTTSIALNASSSSSAPEVTKKNTNTVSGNNLPLPSTSALGLLSAPPPPAVAPLGNPSLLKLGGGAAKAVMTLTQLLNVGSNSELRGVLSLSAIKSENDNESPTSDITSLSSPLAASKFSMLKELNSSIARSQGGTSRSSSSSSVCSDDSNDSENSKASKSGNKRKKKRMKKASGGKKKSNAGDGASKTEARRWTDAQDESLRRAVEQHNGQNWKAIAKMVPDRDHVQCLQRWKKVLQPGLVKGMWKKEEDDKLRHLMDNSQPRNWADIAAMIPGRTAKQCRERWSLNLDPSINRNAWTQEEDDMLLDLHEKLGNRWAEIKRHLKGRTENAVKTRFKSIERSRQKDQKVQWTPELEEQLNDLATRFEGKIDQVAKHLPRSLRGISSQAMRAHCPLLRETAVQGKAAAALAAGE